MKLLKIQTRRSFGEAQGKKEMSQICPKRRTAGQATCCKWLILLVARDGIELQGSIDNTQVVDFALCQKGEKGHSAGSAVQNWYKNSFPIKPLLQSQHENIRRRLTR